MIKRITIGDVRVTFTLARIAKVIGVNSQLDEDRHILMWDFDDVSLEEVVAALNVVKNRYSLSNIYVLETKKDTNYIAYCFTALDWRRVVEIIAQTEHIDWNFFKYGVYRGRFTLRVTPKDGRTPKFKCMLEGLGLPDCEPSELMS